VPFETPQVSVISSICVLVSPLSQIMVLAASTSFFLVLVVASCILLPLLFGYIAVNDLKSMKI